jgi:arsenate reductase
LLGQGATIQQYINLKEEPIDRNVLLSLTQGVGGVEQLFSKRAMKYRLLGLHEKTLSDEDMIGYMLEEYTFIKRPVIVTSRGTLAGFSKKQYQNLLAG